MPKIYEVDQIKDGHLFPLSELCQTTQLKSEFVTLCIDYGITDVHRPVGREWEFSISAVARLQKAYRLQRDLSINFTGLGVVLDLLDDIEDLQFQLNIVTKRLQHWEIQDSLDTEIK